MLFYKFQVTCEFKFPKNVSNSFENSRAFKFQLGELSGALSEGIDGDKVRVLIHRSRQNVFQMLVAVNGFQELTTAKLTRLLEKFFADHDEFGVKSVKIKDLQEITTTKFSKIFDRANRSENFNFDYYQINQDLGLDALENRTFKLTEIICPVKRLPFETAKKDAQNLLADETFKEEFERIYSKENVHHFYGQPVHYKILAGNTSAALSLSNLLVATLYTNKRLVSRRINIITNVTDNCYDETDFEKILENAAGGTVIIELSGEKVNSGQFAHAYEQVVEFVSETVKRYQRNTLCIFIELADRPGFAPQLIARLQDDLHIIELHEGAGNRETALSYLKDLLSDADSATLYTDEELLEAMGDKLTFSASDIFNVREKLFNSSLKNKTYPAYREVDRLSVKSEEKSNDAYADFQEMIGLTEQKALIEQIIAANRVQKMRVDMNLEKQKAALHMSFTGNPGSAKTTVA
ncbi:MAG: hypothetical protein IKN16_00305, partial [Selenomonadaceae bacterium]|nr:hypothetical protein [Selenomonadaceae bacterium]